MSLNLRPPDVSYWRAASVGAIVSAASERFTSGQGVLLLDDIRRQASDAQAQHNDAALMAMLEEYAPDAPQLTNYPG